MNGKCHHGDTEARRKQIPIADERGFGFWIVIVTTLQSFAPFSSVAVNPFFRLRAITAITRDHGDYVLIARAAYVDGESPVGCVGSGDLDF